MDNQNYFGEKPKGRQAIYFIEDGEDYHVNPIYSIDEEKNSPDRFVIVKTTANGRFLIGNKIHYRFNGIDIITDSSNAIFVDTINRTVFVREYEKALNEIAPVDPEKRQYVMLFYDPYGEDHNTEWQSVEGRTAAYNYIKTHIELFDPKQSIVLTDNVALKDALTVSQFVKYLKNGDIIGDDGFDIEDFEMQEY
ncbi:MAG: hypothetical protein NC548_15705 [Lachnospiraceae bacterium]|nr:hypothetical protein [Lachnospiraceae bacterium]